MSQIHNLFRELAAGNGPALAAIDILETGGLPEKEAKALAYQVFAALMPTPPKGRRHDRWSFWGVASEQCLWKGMYGYNAEAHARWLAKNIHRAERSLFTPIPNLPHARVGIW